MDTLNQLGGLVLGSVPTMMFFIALVGLYTVLVRRPLERTLAERKARTSGAVEQARAAIARAEAKTTEYEDKLRTARGEIVAERERRVQGWQQQRDAALAKVRETAQERVGASRKEIEEAAAAARRQIEGATAQLSEQILKAVLPSGAKLSEAAQP